MLQCVSQRRLFDIPDTLAPFAFAESEERTAAEETTDAIPSGDSNADDIESIRSFLNAPFAQIEPFAAYVTGQAAFDTHQGVKGLEFPRCLVVMDDDEARGFLFSYEKLFGTKTRHALTSNTSELETTLELIVLADCST